MKKLFTILLSVFALTVFAQSPNSMNYQAIVKDGSGMPMSSKAIGVQVQILQGSTTGNVEFTEEHSITTNASGLFSLEIGSASNIDVDWSTGPKFMKVSIDSTNGSNYVEYSNSKILAVPYSLQSERSNSSNKLNIDTVGNLTMISQTVDTSMVLVELQIPNTAFSDFINQHNIITSHNGISFSHQARTGPIITLNAINNNNGLIYATGDIIKFDIITYTRDGLKYYTYSVVIP